MQAGHLLLPTASPAPRIAGAPRRRAKRWLSARVAVVLILLALLLLPVTVGVRLAVAGVHLYHQLQTAQTEITASEAALKTLTTGKLDVAALDSASAHLSRADTALGAARAQEAMLAWTLPLAANVSAASDATALPVLLDLAHQVVLGGEAALAGVRPLAVLVAGQAAAGTSASSAKTQVGAAFLAALDTGRPQFQAAQADFARAASELGRVPPQMLGGRVAHLLSSLATRLPELQQGVAALDVLPALLGAHGTRNYLLVAMDSDDLRPTGGFFGSWGVVTVQNGAITHLDYRSFQRWVYGGAPDPGVPFPAPLYHYFADQGGFGPQTHWMMQDSWYPDFPTQARQMERFQGVYDPGVHIDGVIVVGLSLFRGFLNLTGPIQVPGYSQTVTSQNFEQTLFAFDYGNLVQVEQSQGHDFVDKDFLVKVVHSTVDRLLQLPHAQLMPLGQMVQGVFGSADAFVYLNQPIEESLIQRLHWDGAIASGAGDYLMLNEASMSNNKRIQYVTRAVTYTVDFSKPGLPVATLAVTYHNPTPPPGAPSGGVPEYRNYLRVYAPAGSQLVRATGYGAPISQSSDAGKTVFGGYLVIQPGTSVTVTLTYHLPAPLAFHPGGAYALTIQKQGGIAMLPVRVTLVWPAGEQPTDLTTGAVADAKGSGSAWQLSVQLNTTLGLTWT
jgi:hypothetical protein